MTSLLVLASVEDTVYDVTRVLRVPVIIAALVALVLVVAESGSLGVEMWRRRGRRARERQLKEAARGARRALEAGDQLAAERELRAIRPTPRMWVAIRQLLTDAGTGPDSSGWLSKTIADFDLRSAQRLERTRILVRFGPALGLMGTLIPLSPALAGLASGNINELTDNLRVAFSVTVLGLLIGAIAYWISLVRDRLYSQDVSDLEAIAAGIDGVERGATPSVEPVDAEQVGAFS